MTKEKILEYFKDINYAYNDCTRYDTLKRMLDELQEPCDDAISRQAVLDAMSGTWKHICYVARRRKPTKGEEAVYSDMIGTVKSLPFIRPQEPCTDAISRREAIKKITYNGKGECIPDYDCENFPTQIAMKTVKKILRELPPVTPAEKVGQWEWNQYDGNPKIGNFHCSQCHGIGKSYYDYCPHCGAKMEASQTGEEVEE